MNPPGPGTQENQRQPVFLVPGVITALAGLVWAIHLAAVMVLDQYGVGNLRIWFGFIPLRLADPEALPGGYLPLIWSGFTHAFLHADFPHLIVNTAWLAIFGTPVARRYGAFPTLAVFLLGAFAGALLLTLHQLSNINQFLVLIGASGGVSALTGAAMRFVFQPLIMRPDPETGEPVPVGRATASFGEMMRNPRSRAFIIFWLGINLLIPLAPLVTGVVIPIAWEAHIGGFIAGLFMVPLLDSRARRHQMPGNQR